MSEKTAYDLMLDDVHKEVENWRLRSVLADWLDDHSRYDEADAHRYMADNRKRPYSDDKVKAAWFNEGTVPAGLADKESDIAPEVYGKLEGGKVEANHRTYESIAEASQAFIKAWILAFRTAAPVQNT